MKRQISTPICGFPLRGFANSRRCIQNKYISLRPINGQKHQTCSTNQTGLRNLPHDVEGVERGKTRRSLHHNLCTKKEQTLEKSKQKKFWGEEGCGSGKFFVDFRLLQEVLEPNTLERRGMELFNTKFDTGLCSEILSLF